MNNRRVFGLFNVLPSPQPSLVSARASTSASTPSSTPSRFATSILGYGVLVGSNCGQVNL